ncbi:nucleotide disphospho-sugar-binding domain-containing protein [Micromonospora sp. RTGN7]|uniref:nucleotide disphospho-sugar-binding domain-containing protein n=1 Tax=Micromonospora sp. RTGN7 TaxID=3016526 RepID=UPI0029FED3E3|nr:nucleotide disphospho-sugar-binding domain-containing protein [Micromonospora sp. RTGN7]
MRILFTCWAWPSHLYAMVPVAWACRAAGHEVLVASQPALSDTITRTGLPAAVVGRDVDAEQVFRDVVFTPPGADGGGPRVLNLLSQLAETMTGDLADLAHRWGADLVVSDPTAFAGPLAAAVAGIPAVRHLYGTDLMSAAGRFLPGVLAPLAERHGVGPVDAFGVATIDPYPAGLQVPVASRRLPVRPLPFNGPGALPPTLPQPAGRARVCVTWGTTPGRLDPSLFLAGDVVRALHGTGIDLVVAVAPEQRALLGTVPDDVTVLSSPLHLLLPECDAVIGHGGAGTLLTAVTHGLPQLLVPRLPDHVRHADRVAAAGAGVVVPAPLVEPAALVAGLTALLDDPAYRAAAVRLRDEAASQPTPARLVDDLAALLAPARG